MLSNAYFLAKFRFDTAENEPAKNLQNFRKMHFSKMHFSKMHFSKMHFSKMHFTKTHFSMGARRPPAPTPRRRSGAAGPAPIRAAGSVSPDEARDASLVAVADEVTYHHRGLSNTPH